jgi:hypothetical protein
LDKPRFAGSGGPIPPGWWFSARGKRIMLWPSESGDQRIRQSSTLRFHFVVVNTDLEKREIVQKGIRVSHLELTMILTGRCDSTSRGSGGC